MPLSGFGPRMGYITADKTVFVARKGSSKEGIFFLLPKAVEDWICFPFMQTVPVASALKRRL